MISWKDSVLEVYARRKKGVTKRLKAQNET